MAEGKSKTRAALTRCSGFQKGPTPCQGLGFATVWNISQGDYRCGSTLGQIGSHVKP